MTLLYELERIQAFWVNSLKWRLWLKEGKPMCEKHDKPEYKGEHLL